MDDVGIQTMRALVAVADAGSVTRAAIQLGRTQPAVSLQLRRLEEIAATKLFNWEGRRLVFTREGELVLAHARRILSMSRELTAQLRASKVAGALVIGVPDLYVASFLPSILEHFAEAYPAVQIELRSQASKDLLPSLSRGELDLVLVTRRSDVAGGRFVRREPLVWAGSDRHELFRQPVLPIAVYPAGYLVRSLALAALAATERPYAIVAVSENITGLQAALTAGLAITALPKCSLSPGIREIDDRLLPRLPSIDLMTHIRGDAPKAAAVFRDFLTDQLADVAGDKIRRRSRARSP